MPLYTGRPVTLVAALPSHHHGERSITQGIAHARRVRRAGEPPYMPCTSNVDSKVSAMSVKK